MQPVPTHPPPQPVWEEAYQQENYEVHIMKISVNDRRGLWGCLGGWMGAKRHLTVDRID
jgi:hypothetical protein